MGIKLNPYVKKAVRIMLWSALTIVFFLLLIIVLIQVPAVQNFTKDRVITYLNDKLKTKSSLDRIAISFPKTIVLEGFYFEDQRQDTLLSGKRLAIDIDLFKIINHEVEINSVELENTTANISRNKDGAFNYDYIIKAFASTEPKDPNSKPYSISVVDVDLKNIRFNFKDDLSNNDFRLKLENFSTKFKKFDLDKMDFNIPYIDLNGLNVVLNQDLVQKIAEVSVKTVDTIAKRTDFNLELKKITLSKINVLYDNKNSKMNSGLTLGKLNLLVNDIDIKNKMFDFVSFELNGLKGNLLLGKKEKQIQAPDMTASASRTEGWKMKLESIDLQNIAFKFDDMEFPVTANGIDYRHLDMNGLNAKGKQIYFANDTISGKVKSLTVNEKSGLKIEQLRTQFFYGPKQAYLNDLYLRTPQTELKDKLKVNYQSIGSISKKIGDLSIDANLSQSRIGFKDVLLFAPQLRKTNPFLSNPNAILYINSRVNGKVKDLNIPYFQMQGIGNTKVSVSGKIKGLPNYEKAFFDLDIKNITSSSRDVISFVPEGSLPKTIRLPEQFNANGKFKGTIDNFKTKLLLNSSYGKANVDALFDRRIKSGEKYDATIAFMDFNLGRLIKNDSLGKITLNAKVKGQGLNPKTANAKLVAIVKKADFNKYTYSNMALKGTIAKGNFDIKADSKDPNLKFKLDANGGFKDKYPDVKLNLNLDIADLEKLNLHAGPMKLRGNVVADIANSNPDYLNGEIVASNVQILQDTEPIVLDKVKIIAFSDNQKNNIKISSQFIQAEIDGKYKLTTLSDAIKNSLSKYINVQSAKYKPNSENQQFTFTIAVQNDPILYKLIPKLTGLDPINISGKYNSVGDTLEIKGAIPKIIYANTTISDGKINVATKNNALEYQVSVATIEGGQFKIPFTSLSGKAENNILSYALQVKDKEKKDLYFVAGELLHEDSKNIIKLNAENLILNYDKWNINPENSIEFGDQRLYVNKFYLDHSGNELKIQSQNNQNNAPLHVDFVNFKMETILNMIKKEEFVMQGLINGSVVLDNVMVNPIFTSDLTIDKFAFGGEPIGDISLKVDNKTSNILSANMTLSGEGNDLALLGTYRIDNENFDLDLDVNQLNIKSIQGFSFGNITDGKGSLSGQFKITGNALEPKVNGELLFKDAGFRITKLNSYFTVNDEKIALRNEEIAFDNFSIFDENGNELGVNGRMTTQNFRDFNFDLAVKADDFRAIHSKVTDNDLFYGDLFLDAKLKIGGTLENPLVNGNIEINDETKFTVVLPQSDPSIVDREGIVEFVDEDNLYLKQTAELQKELNQSKFVGMDVSVAITVDKEAEFTLVIDKGNGDYLNLKGEAELTAGIDPSGKTTLTGKYEFDSGSYEMNFNMIRRKFDIQKGSYIIWNGEPTMATVNITAVYKVNTAPLDLLVDQLGTLTPEVKNTYKQKIPFQTLLKMNGELLKPEITFDITLPDGNYNVSSDIVSASQTKLEQLRQNPSELNKQVFALLLLNRFVGENPFSSESGSTSAEYLARQSASKILSQQLNDLAGDLIAGVQLEFDLESTEDYTTGAKETRTDLNVGISKKLLNDRLKVTVGSSFGVEGAERANEDASNIAGDASLEYQLSKDGRYMVRAYRKNEYQVAIQGEIVETGVVFIITMEYNKFRELFKRSAKDIEITKKEQIRKEKKRLEKEKQKAKGLTL
ncbi:translocation/assembly module TamB [Flavobacterium aquariorum]|uniref:Translocation/assembly module TamB n=1 Tax=Flavobacterium aquariorum TaxID=2217670 RepID=A0A2W7U4X6_9FLAO|nr:translocation/assembly module TamB domain-containing protein [Flavobacterium aquariorum]PZX92249.1 translocation/assembly module TamB [Flavobacterium aquariorum]